MILCYFLKALGQALPMTCVRNGTVALTIDEGPSAYTSELLDILEKEKVKATFHFNAGVRGSEFNEIYQRAIDDGHDIGIRTNPSRSYVDFKNDSDVAEDIDQQLKFLQSKIDKDIKFSRSPLNGALPIESVHKYFTKNNIIQTSYSHCLYDDEGNTPEDNLKEYLSPTMYKKDSFIIQLYDQRLGEDGNLSELIKVIREKKYEFVTLSQCLDGYQPGKAIQNKGYHKKSGSSANKIKLSQSFIPILMFFMV